MTDITALILADHDWFREQFAKLDDLQAQESVSRAALDRDGARSPTSSTCTPISKRKSSTRNCSTRGTDNPEGETLDAIGDHNDIRDGVREAHAERVGTDRWWAAVGRTRVANDDHMSEEEREGLSDFRRNAPVGLREALGQQYSEFMAAHPTTEGLSIVDRDPQRYVDEFENGPQPERTDFSLRIGSLKGQ